MEIDLFRRKTLGTRLPPPPPTHTHSKLRCGFAEHAKGERLKFSTNSLIVFSSQERVVGTLMGAYEKRTWVQTTWILIRFWKVFLDLRQI